MSLVWYYPARGLCSPGVRSHAFEKHSGSILPWEWRMLDRGHSVAFQESHSASENNSRVEYIRSHGEQSCANPRRLEFCFRNDPDSDQAHRESLELEPPRIPEREKMICYTSPSFVGPDGRGPSAPRSINLDA